MIAKLLNASKARASGMFAAALGIIFIFLIVKSSGLYPMVLSDENTYSKFSRLLPLSESTIPGYLYLSIYKLTSHCGADFLGCARLLNIIFFVAAGPFIYWVARRVTTGVPAALIALLALLAPVSSYTAYYMPEAFYFLGFWVFTWFVLRLDNASIRGWGVAGAIFGVTALIKPHSFLFMPAIIFYLGYVSLSATRRLSLFVQTSACFVVAALLVKFLVGYAVAGKAGLTLFGTAYTEIAASTTSNTQRYLELITISISSIKGHILALCLMFGPALAIAIYLFCKNFTPRQPSTAEQKLILWTLLVLSNLVVVVGLFTASVTNVGPYETATRLHMRYYDFVFPLLFIVVASQLQITDALKRKWRALPAIVIGVLALYALYTRMAPYTPNYVDSPELHGVVTNQAILYALGVLGVACLAAWVYSVRAGARLFIYVVMPLSILIGTGYATYDQRRSLSADVYVRAALFTQQYLSREDSAVVMIIGSDLVGMYKTLFLLDTATGRLRSVPEGDGYNMSDIPDGRKWLLAIGDIPVHGDNLFKVSRPGFTLIKAFAPITVDFKQSAWTDVVGTQGFAAAEAWGAWTSAAQASITFAIPLPEKVRIRLTGHAFGPNVGKPIVAHLGSSSQSFTLQEADSEISLDLSNPSRASELRLTIPSPTSPRELGMGEDGRQLGIGLTELTVIAQ